MKSKQGCNYIRSDTRIYGKINSLFHLIQKHSYLSISDLPKKIVAFLINLNFTGEGYVYRNYCTIKKSKNTEFEISNIFDENVYNINLNTIRPIIVDLGCNVGLTILYFKYKYKDAVIYGYEANQLLAEDLYENITHNVADLKNIHLFFKAVVGNKSETNLLYVDSFSNVGSTLNKDVLNKNIQYNKIYVNTITLESIIKKFKMIDLLKIDIEGEEYNLISTIKKYHKNIKHFIVELHNCSQDRCMSFMNSFCRNFILVEIPTTHKNLTFMDYVNDKLSLGKNKSIIMVYAKHK